MWQAGRPARLPHPVPKRGRKLTGQLSAWPSSVEVSLLSKPPRRPSYAPRGPGVEPACLEERDHTESPAGRPGRLLIVCVCWGGWLLLGSSHPHTLSPVQGGLPKRSPGTRRPRPGQAVCSVLCLKSLYK